jgi:glycosyltransferase involved in cell wall biosynthesis
MVRRGREDAPEVALTPDGGLESHPWKDWGTRDNVDQKLNLPDHRPLRVLQYCGGLYCGGAERQLSNLSAGLAARGVDVRVRTTHPPVGEVGHYRPLLARHGISVGAATVRSRPPATFDHRRLARVPVRLHQAVLGLGGEIARHRPDVLHCWLDEPNIIGGVAGLLAGVPRILLAVRNVNPTHFPRLHAPFMHTWYRLLASSRRVHFLSNSRAGAESYADWLRISAQRFHLVPNGVCFDDFPRRSPAGVVAARATFGLSERDPVICGIFRLDEEKRPEVFLAVLREVKRRVPHLKAILAGCGRLESQVRDTVRKYGMQSYVKLLGRCEDVGTLLLASDLLLLTSTHEGCPNAVIEAQALGVPVVATRGGGTPEALADGSTGFLSPVDDVADLARNVVHLILDRDLRAQFSSNAMSFARQHFDLNEMVLRTSLVYQHMFGPCF